LESIGPPEINNDRQLQESYISSLHVKVAKRMRVLSRKSFCFLFSFYMYLQVINIKPVALLIRPTGRWWAWASCGVTTGELLLSAAGDILKVILVVLVADDTAHGAHRTVRVPVSYPFFETNRHLIICHLPVCCKHLCSSSRRLL
jgi:hypothetical protein